MEVANGYLAKGRGVEHWSKPTKGARVVRHGDCKGHKCRKAHATQTVRRD